MRVARAGLYIQAALAFLLGGPLACAPNSVPSAELELTEGQGIIGGVRADAQSPGFASVVLFLGPEERLASPDKLDFSTCTGVLVDENVVLTAAHCVKALRERVQEFQRGSVDDMGLIAFAAAPNQTRKVTGFIQHESFSGWRWTHIRNGYMPRTPHDLALVAFEGVRPRESQLARLGTYDPKVVVQRPFHLFGYGMIGVSMGYELERNSLIRRGRQAFVREAPLQYLSREASYSPELDYGFILDQRGRPGICHGDSGGPAFIENDGGVWLVGVNSHSTGIYRDQTMVLSKAAEKVTHDCQYFAVLTRISPYVEWIEREKKLLLENDCSRRADFRQYLADFLGVRTENMELHKISSPKRKFYRFSGQGYPGFEKSELTFQADSLCRIRPSQGHLLLTESPPTSLSILETRSAFEPELRAERARESFLRDRLPERREKSQRPEPELASAFPIEVLLKSLAAQETWKLRRDRHAIHALRIDPRNGKLRPSDFGSDVLAIVGLEKYTEAVIQGLRRGLRMAVVIYVDDQDIQHQELWVRDIQTHEIWLLRQIVSGS